MRAFIFVACCVTTVLSDCYLHNPRGSNNRLNEQSANRNNANRAFDSQNNNRGGYNVGDRTQKEKGSRAEQFALKYFTSEKGHLKSAADDSSYLTIEWTNQHGCGGNEDSDPNKLNCNMVLQFMCRPAGGAASKTDVRDGTTTDQIKYNEPKDNQDNNNENTNRNAANRDVKKVYQESFFAYDKCVKRERNKGLFTADQKVKNNKGARATRQNPNGNRNGLECPEERDHYPYWHPTEWKDIAVLTDQPNMCAYYKNYTFNTKVKHECIHTNRQWSKANNEADCTKEGGAWTAVSNFLEKAKGPRSTNKAKCEEKSTDGVEYEWAVPLFANQKDAEGNIQKECLVKLQDPECKAADWSRVNHLGNGRSGEPLSYEWKLPNFPSGIKQACVLRIRYNISTDDYDPWNTDSSSNRNTAEGIVSPVTQNPAIEIGANNVPLRLAINTAQFGRTFQDRSHMFYMDARPPGTEGKSIKNLSVRGKRGNIVQTFPAVEYDFFPTNTVLKANSELLHIQWTGSNTHDNGKNAGDGQQGDAGEGKGGTDRHNLCQIADRNHNYPLPFEVEKANMFEDVKLYWAADTSKAIGTLTETDLQLRLCSGGYFGDVSKLKTKAAINNQLDNVSPSFGGLLLGFKKKGSIYNFMCTRNNNFTNRSQKGTITVK